MTEFKPITKYVADWISRADEDIKVAEILLEEKSVPNSVCFHCQQAGEKYFKAFLAFQEKNVRKIHDLNALLILCEEIDKSFDGLKSETDYLNKFYVETRYPGDYPEFSWQDAKEAFDATLRIKEFILEKIKSNQ